MTPAYDAEFVRLVRYHLEPVLTEAGFVYSEVSAGPEPRKVPLVSESRWPRLPRLLSRRGSADTSPVFGGTTSVLYEADAQEFATTYPGSDERPTRPDSKDLWVYYESSAGLLDFGLQGERLDLGDLGAVVNDGSRSLEDRVAAMARVLARFLAQARAQH